MNIPKIKFHNQELKALYTQQKMLNIDDPLYPVKLLKLLDQEKQILDQIKMELMK